MTHLVSNLYNGFDTIIAFKETLLEVMALSWNPDRLLGVVRPVLVLTFHLQGEKLKRGHVVICNLLLAFSFISSMYKFKTTYIFRCEF